MSHSQGMKSSNSGVCVRGMNGQLEDDYYGRLTEVLELEYFGNPTNKLVLFRCEWFDPSPNVGTKVNNMYGLVDVKESRRYQVYDPFIFSQQADQVYYTRYPEGHEGWLAVMKIKARSAVTDNIITLNHEDAPYQDITYIDGLHIMLNIDPSDHHFMNLATNDGSYDEVDRELIDQQELIEESDNAYVSEDDDESDVNDTD